ncbi:DUF3857 domain-containing protein [Sphingobacterium hungaricum]
MNRLLYSTLIFFCLSTAFAQQELASENIPKNLLPRANAVVRNQVTQLDIKSEKEVVETVSEAITILNKRGDSYADINLYYNKSASIKSLKGEILNEHGTVLQKLALKNFSDRSITDDGTMFADYRVKTYSPNIMEYPYTIVYTYEIVHKQSLSIPYWRPNYYDDVAVEKSKFIFTSPPAMELRVESKNLSKEPKIENSDKLKSYTFEAENLPARKTEPFSPNSDLTSILVKVIPKTFFYYSKQSTVNDWNDFGKWVYDDLLKDKRQLPAKAVEEVKNLIKDAKTDQEKAQILYRYMQNKTRYISVQIGIGGLEPFSAQYVDQLSYGDCKALVNYMQSLLDVAGIPSYYCIVEAGSRKIDLDVNFANAMDGNHIILCLPFEQDTTWLECTNNKIPYGFLGDFTDDRLVLACTEEGGKILRTPKYPHEDNLQKRTSHFKILEDGSLKGTVNTLFMGSQFDNHFYNQFLSPTELNKRLKDQYDVDNIVFEKVKYSLNENKIPTIEENMDVFIKSYVVKSQNSKIILPNLFSVGGTIPDLKERINPVYINRSFVDIDTLIFDLPEDVLPIVKPEQKIIKAPMGYYEMNTLVKDNQLHYYRRFELFQGTYPPESYATFNQLMKDASSSDKGRYKLSVKTTE